MMFKGKPLEELSREELVEAVQVLQHQYQAMKSLFKEQLRLAETKYTPKTWLGRLVRRLT